MTAGEMNGTSGNNNCKEPKLEGLVQQQNQLQQQQQMPPPPFLGMDLGAAGLPGSVVGGQVGQLSSVVDHHVGDPQFSDNASGGDYDDDDEDDDGDDGDEGQSSSEGGAVEGVVPVHSLHQPQGTPKSDMAEIKDNLKWLNHQMRMLMHTFSVPFCKCAQCLSSGFNNNSHHFIKGELGSGMMVGFNKPSINGGTVLPNDPNQMEMDGTGAGGAAGLVGELNSQFNNGIEYQKRGRRSKYCTPQERKMVAKYAQLYGASAAARKFGIPPAVAAYYHRKDFRKESKAGFNQSTEGIQSPYPKPSLKIPPIAGEGQPDGGGGGGTGDGLQNQQQQSQSQQQLQQQGNGTIGGDGSAAGDEISQMMNQVSGGDAMNENWAAMGNLAQQHAFLRGRGRGRPKLIGDELDAELVEWMCLLKQANPGQHINASQALVLARNYIMEKSPGLLAENGGQVKLRITWAMKLLARVVEREREIQLGLPPGTLQNMTRINSTTIGNNSQAPGASGPTLGPTLDELQQLFGQVSNFQGSSKNNFLGAAGMDAGEEASPDQLLADLAGPNGIDNELIQKLLGNLQGQADSLGFPSSSTGAPSSANDFLAQTTGAFC